MEGATRRGCSTVTNRRFAVTWFAVQSLAVAGWWLLLAVKTDARALFVLPDAPFVTLGAFAPGDLLLVSFGSAVVAMRRGTGWTRPLSWMVTGAMIYGAMYTATIVVVRDGPFLSAILMVPAALLTLGSAAALSRDGSVNDLRTSSAA